MRKSGKSSAGRRKFLKGAAVGGVATLVASTGAARAQQSLAARASSVPAVPPPEADPPSEISVLTVERAGSDFMVDVLKSLGFEYLAANPGSSFAGLHESVINYGGNKNPEFITCCHEESSVALAHGYAMVEGKPILVMAHSTVGLQHASMGIYNAYAGPFAGVHHCSAIPLDATASGGRQRQMVSQRPGPGSHGPGLHQVGRPPVSLAHFAESAVRAYQARDDPADDARG